MLLTGIISALLNQRGSGIHRNQLMYSYPRGVLGAYRSDVQLPVRCVGCIWIWCTATREVCWVHVDLMYSYLWGVLVHVDLMYSYLWCVLGACGSDEQLPVRCVRWMRIWCTATCEVCGVNTDLMYSYPWGELGACGSVGKECK